MAVAPVYSSRHRNALLEGRCVWVARTSRELGVETENASTLVAEVLHNISKVSDSKSWGMVLPVLLVAMAKNCTNCTGQEVCKELANGGYR
jgi:hypothetical protein